MLVSGHNEPFSSVGCYFENKIQVIPSSLPAPSVPHSEDHGSRRCADPDSGHSGSSSRMRNSDSHDVADSVLHTRRKRQMTEVDVVAGDISSRRWKQAWQCHPGG